MEATVNPELKPIVEIRDEMLTAARDAADRKYAEIGGDRYACGFAWVTIYPNHKGNTKAGRAERQTLAEMGFRKDWTGKAYELWNPSGHPCQNVDTKEAGARAAAEVLKRYGFRAYAGSRLD
jgi:hypothetical protein